MRLKTVWIANFRCYREEMRIDFSDLTTLIGKNDIGKSTVLEALEIFFNNDSVKIEQSDVNVCSGDTKVCITCEFDDVPEKVILDSGAETSLADEYLLTAEKTIKIRKVSECKNKTPSSDVYIVALHPTAKGFDNFLELKEKDLQQKIKDLHLDVSLKGNPGMRAALWGAADYLAVKETLVCVSKSKEDGKRIWERIQEYLPVYALFQSDRSSLDSDGEVQNPMKAAVAAAIVEM